MFTKNNTKEWPDSLSPEKKRMVLQLARNFKQSQRQQYIERKAAIRRRREEKLHSETRKGKKRNKRKSTERKFSSEGRRAWWPLENNCGG